MANDAVHYRDLAARAQAEADEAALDNVRDRALRSAAAFATMAQQHERMAKRRAEREAARDDSGTGDAIGGSPMIQTDKEQT